LPQLRTLTGTVLLVDPDPLARAATAAEIEHLGLTVYAASGAADALAWCERTSTRVDILMTETPLPSMSGCELAERVGRLKPGVRCLFSTSTDHPALCEEIRTTVLVKPFEHQELVASLAELLSGSSAADEPVDSAAGVASYAPSTAARTILVVEDYAPTRLAISDALADAGHETVTVANVGEALRSARRMPVLDLLLCDARLPDGDGADLVRAVREIHSAARIILMSGASAPSRPRSAPPDAFLSKPFDLDTLVSTVDRVLGQPAGSGR
jgi:DNA-binding NtrC family response regulator